MSESPANNPPDPNAGHETSEIDAGVAIKSVIAIGVLLVVAFWMSSVYIGGLTTEPDTEYHVVLVELPEDADDRKACLEVLGDLLDLAPDAPAEEILEKVGELPATVATYPREARAEALMENLESTGASVRLGGRESLSRIVRRGPRLDPAQPVSRRRLLAEQRELADSYEWIDEKAGIARIPVKRAMDVLVERGLEAVSDDEGEEATDTETNDAETKPNDSPEGGDS